MRDIVVSAKHVNNNNNNNNHDNVYGAVIMAEPLREFTRFVIVCMQKMYTNTGKPVIGRLFDSEVCTGVYFGLSSHTHKFILRDHER